MHRFFIYLYYLIRKNRFVSVLVALGIVLGCLFFASKINFEEDINQIIPKSDKSDLTARILKQLNFSDKIVVIIEKQSKNEEDYSLSETADEFLNKLESQKKYINNIQGKVNEEEIFKTFDFVNQNLPLFLTESDYEKISRKIHNDSLAKQIDDNYNALVSPTSLVTKEFIKKDPLGITFMGIKKLNALNMSDDFMLENNYVVSKDGKSLLLFINPTFKSNDTKNNEPFIKELYKIQENINKEFKNKSQLSYFGSPLIAVANAQQIKKDIQTTVVISFSVLLLVLIFYFKNIFTPLIVFLPTLFSVALALMILYFIKDKVSAISLSVGAILLGITIDYALHILTHYKHNNNIQELYKEITRPLILSSTTTAVSFLCLVLVRSEALRDLGIFAAITVILSAVAALIIVPQLYTPKKEKQKKTSNFIDKLGSYPYEKNKFLIIGCSLLIVICLFGFNKVGFNEDIGDLNFVPKDLKISESKLEKLSDIADKSIYTISYGNTQEEALQSNNNLVKILEKEKNEGNILSYNSIGNIVLSKKQQQERIQRWNQFWRDKKISTINGLVQNGNKYGFNSNAFDDFNSLLNKQFSTLHLKDYEQLNALQLSEFMTSENNFYTITNITKVKENQRNSFIKNIEKNEKVIAIDRQQMNENFLGLLKRDFNTLINYSLLAIIFTIILFFRNFELSLLTMFPIVLTGVVTAGLLYFLNLELNIFSTIVCTLVFGVGDDFSIFLTQSMQKEHTDGKNSLPTYRTSIVLAVLTTVLSIGSLIFAKHPALHSLALVALIGMFSVIIITSTLYPFWFRLLIINRQKKGLSPITLRLFLNSAISFIYYGLGGLFFSFLGHSFVKNAKGKKLENIKKFIAKYLTSVLYTNPFVKKRTIKNPEEDFSKPAIIIANHTSFLDTLAIAMATHKIIYLVNDWVYDSPVFGKLVKALGFFPVSKGIENGTQQLKEKIEQGYSLMIFPEAERSYDNNVKRFHKGAFYLAEEFQLDILPIYIHGNSEVQPKGDFIIYDGTITVKVGDRIHHEDKNFGISYKERTKRINTYFREKFTELRSELEEKNYFRKKLFLSYIYKEKHVVKAIKEDFEANNSIYFELNKHISPDAKILHISEDYGQKDVLLTLYQASRKIYSYINNEEKRLVAKNNYLVKKRKLNYLDSLQNFENEIDVLLISDTSFEFSHLKQIPETIIFLKTSDKKLSNNHYKCTFETENIHILTKTIQ